MSVMRRAPTLLVTSALVTACTAAAERDVGGADEADATASDGDASSSETTATSSSESSSDASSSSDETGDEPPSDACGGCVAPQVCIPELGCTSCEGDVPCPDLMLYAAPEGRGDACSFDAPCKLHTAQQRVREAAPQQAGDIVVYLRGGTYWLGEEGPLVLDPSLDSGQFGHAIVYRAFPGELPVLSGARPLVAGWTLIDPVLSIWRTSSQAPGSRHLIVDGALARRARGPELPPGFSETASGYLAPDATMASWSSEGLELVGYREWKSFRCPVASIVGTAITIAPTCWANAQWHQGQGFDFTLALPQWFENAPQLLDEPGEFFRSLDGTTLDYIPLPGQDLATVEAREPLLVHLIESLGTPAAPLHDLRFVGIGFADTTMSLGSDGFSELQAGIFHVGAQVQDKLPAALDFATAERVEVVEGRFERLGSAGVSFGAGSKDTLLVGNRFDRLGALAIQVGDVRETWHHHVEDDGQVTRGNLIRDNFITRIGLDFPGSPGIWVGYAQQTEIRNNDLFDLPYTGISVGWGWGGVDVGGSGGFMTPASSGENAILDNRVGYFMRVLRDGGGIYVLGAQPMSIEQGNTIYNQGNPYAAIYLDNGTQFYAVSENVVEKVPHWLLCQTWSTNATNNQVTGNYSELDNPFTLDPHPSNVIADNVFYGATMPAAAAAIVAASGLSGAYRAMHGDDVARGRPVAASSSWSDAYAPALALDGEGKTGWSPLGPDQDPDPWLQVDLGSPVHVARVEVVTRWDLDQADTRTSLELLGSDDPSFADAELLGRSGPTALPHRAIWALEPSSARPHRYVRVRREGGGYMFVAELRVLAAP